MKISLLQMNPAWHDPSANLKTASAMIASAARDGAVVAALPEMFSSGFSMDNDAACERMDGPVFQGLSALAKEYGIFIIAGIATLNESGPVNTAQVFSPDGAIISSFTKLHPFALAGEHDVYAPGSSAVVFEAACVPSSVFICYDLRFPEVFRAVANEASIVYVLANWPASRMAHWRALLKARAIENQCFVVGVNRTGTDDNSIAYAGGSSVISPMGDEIFYSEAVGAHTVEIDPLDVGRVRADLPFLRDMRP